MKTDSKPTTPEKEWLIFSVFDYAQAIGEMVDHSFKIVHSAILGGGVRVSSDKGVKLPYVSVRMLLGHDVPVLTDQFGKGPTAIRIHQQITAVAEGLADHAPADDVAWIQQLLDGARKTTFVKCKSLSPRLRQILLPTDQGYLSVTPLSSAGVAVQIASGIKALSDQVAEQSKKKDAPSTLRKIRRGSTPFGGSKPFNVGNLVYKISQPMVGAFPIADNELRHAISVFYTGCTSLGLPSSLVNSYTKWRNNASGETYSNATMRDEHRAFLKRFTKHWLSIGQDARDLLLEHRDDLPSQDQLCSPNLSAFHRGLIQPDLRDSNWIYAFASRLAHHVSKLEKDNDRRFEYTQTEINDMSTIVRSLLV